MRSNPKIVSLSPPTQAAAGLVANAARRTDMMIDLLVECAPQLRAKYGVTRSWLEDQRNLAGDGSSAVAWWLPNGSSVLKVTTDASDAAAAHMVMGAKEGVEGLVPIFDVFAIECKPGMERQLAFLTKIAAVRKPAGVYLIVSETAEPTPPSERKAKAMVVAQQVLLRVAGHDDADMSILADRFGAGEVVRRLTADTPDQDIVASYVHTLATGLRWLRDRNFIVTDLGIDNFGWSENRNEPMLLDFGSSKWEPPSVALPIARNGSLPLPRVRAAFDEHFDIIEKKFPDFGDIELHLDEKAASDNGHGSERQFGYCMNSKPLRIAFAAKTDQLPTENIRALVAHEFGHALDFRYGNKLEKMIGAKLPSGAERKADAIASRVFGRTIKYDGRDIQCVDCDGTSPRPKRLGA